jgi:hypothetical protein
MFDTQVPIAGISAAKTAPYAFVFARLCHSKALGSVANWSFAADQT